MSVFKCKMCGGSLEVSDDSVIAVCDYCGIKGTTRLYETKDGRDICLCRLCTDKIHPTNNYVKIIYTPVGGKNR